MSGEARVYRILNDFDTRCNKCSLACQRAIAGHTFCGNNKVQMLLVGAYPGAEEVKQGFSYAPNKQRDKFDIINAGRFLRASIHATFDSDPNIPKSLKPFYKYTGFSNMIKCSPVIRKVRATVTAKHINSCSSWLEKEIDTLSIFNPNIPIMLCGSEAVKLLDKKMTVYHNRRKIFRYKNRNPVIISFNPVEVVRYTPYRVKEEQIKNNGRRIVTGIEVQSPLIFGSQGWHWTEDLMLMKELVLENYYSTNKKIENLTDLRRKYING